MSQVAENAQFGAKAFDPGTDKLPGVFPREMGPNAEAYLKEVVDAGLASDMYDRFTTYFADMYGVRYCIGVPGCTQAVFASMLGMDFEPGDEIIVSPIADYGTIAGMLFNNYIPVFADTDPGTALISADTIEPLITDRTRAVMCVHKLGLPCDMDPIMELAERHNLLVLTDVCQAILSEYKGSMQKTLGHLACFSFDAEKTCGGDIGGAILTDDKDLYDRINHRALSRGAHKEPGFGRIHTYQGFATRMPQCTAATCLANLEILPRQIRNRQETAALLDDLIRDIDGITPYDVPADRTHTYWMYGFSVSAERFGSSVQEFGERLAANGVPGAGMGQYYLMPEAVRFLGEYVENGIYPFTTPPSSRTYQYNADVTPNARNFLDGWVRWPWTEKYSEAHIRYIAELVAKTAEECR